VFAQSVHPEAEWQPRYRQQSAVAGFVVGKSRPKMVGDEKAVGSTSRELMHRAAASAESALKKGRQAAHPLARCLLSFQLVPFAGGNRIGRIQRFFVELNLENLSGLVDEECCSPHHFGLRVEYAIAPGSIAAKVAQHWEVGAQLIRPGFIRKKPIHGDTQNLGVGRFQLLQILLKALRFLASSTRKRKDVKRQSHVLLPPEILERNLLSILI
jgi:hypothetical protein